MGDFQSYPQITVFWYCLAINWYRLTIWLICKPGLTFNHQNKQRDYGNANGYWDAHWLRLCCLSVCSRRCRLAYFKGSLICGLFIGPVPTVLFIRLECLGCKWMREIFKSSRTNGIMRKECLNESFGRNETYPFIHRHRPSHRLCLVFLSQRVTLPLTNVSIYNLFLTFVWRTVTVLLGNHAYLIRE